MYYDPIKDRLGRVFSRHPALQKAFYALLHVVFLRSWYVRRELDRILSEWPPSQPVRILDAGTGFGQYAYYVARKYRNVHVLAVDVKEAYLDNARRFVERTPERDRVTFRRDDLARLEAEGPFDVILSVDVMEHIEDDRAVFRNFARVLAPNGIVLVNTPSDLGGSDVSGEGDPGFIEEHVRPGYDADELRARLRDAGLHPERTLYTYGTHGSRAWRILVKWPLQMLARTRAAYVFLPFYYVVGLPVGAGLNALDVRTDNETGTGLLITARKRA